MQFTYEHLDWRELVNRLAREDRMAELFRELMLAANGDVERALEYLGELSERYRTELGFDRDEFERHLRHVEIIFAFEEAYGITLEEAEMTDLKTVKSLARRAASAR